MEPFEPAQAEGNGSTLSDVFRYVWDCVLCIFTIGGEAWRPPSAPSRPHYLFFFFLPPSLQALFLPRLLFVITGRLELRLPADEGRCGTKRESSM